MPRGRESGSLRFVIVAVVVALVAAMFPVVSMAAPIVPFTARFSADDNGTIRVFGNNLLSCPTSDSRCAGARAGTASLNNNSFVMANLDTDGVAGTFNSSSATVAGPEGSEVLWAGLYWGARLSRGTGGEVGTGTRQQMSLRPPGAGSYQTVTSQVGFGPTAGDQAYQEFADVTSLVQAAGQGVYWGANVVAGTGEDRYAGWSLVVVFRAPSLPLRNLTVFDGFADVGRSEPQQVMLSGFRAPVSGPVDTQLGMVAYEGDFSTSGDNARLNETLLSTTPLSRGSNFFNGTNDDNGTSAASRTPAHMNMLGFDVKNLAANGIPNGATSATLSFESTGDRYFPGVATTAIRLFAPDFTTSTKTVVDLAGRNPGFPGDELEYRLTYPNTGQDAAVDVTMTDTLPPGTTFVSATPSNGSCAGAGSVLECDIGTIPVGGVWSATVRVLVGPDAGGTTLRNAAVLDYTAQTLDRDLTYVVAPAEIAISAQADLSVDKTMEPDPAFAGGEVTATIVVANDGPNSAQDVVVEDRLPVGAEVVSIDAEQGSCEEGAGVVTCALGSVATGVVVTVTLVLTTPPDTTAVSLVNLASVSSSTADPDPGDNTSAASVALTRAADLVVTKEAADAEVVPGATTSYTITVVNDGPSSADDVVIADAVADERMILTAASAPGATCTVAAAAATCELAALDPGASATMTVEARLSPDTLGAIALLNTATVSSATADPNPDDNTANATVTAAEPSADIAVEKTVGDIVAGGQATYTVEVVNEGPSSASAVALEDVLPDGFTAVSAISSRGTCEIAAAVTCDLGDLPGPDSSGAVSSATVTIVADVPPTQPAEDVSNTATIESLTADPDPTDDVSTATAIVQSVADLAVTKRADPVQPAAGTDVTFTVGVTNRGPSAAADVVLTDALPAGLVLAAVDPGAGIACSAAGTTLTCDAGSLDVGASATVDIVMTVPPDFELDAGAVNTASVTSAATDPAPANDEASATITSRAVSDLITLKWDTTQAPTEPSRTFVAGEEVTYYIAAGNLGPSDASTAVVTDVLPAGVTFVSSIPQCTFAAPATVSCALPDVPVGFAAVFPIVVRLDADLEPGALLTNTASIALTDPERVDPVSDNNVAVRTNAVVVNADLVVTKQTYSLDLPEFTVTSPAAAPAGSQSGYTIDVRNDGPSVARDAVLVDSSTLTRFHVNQVRVIRDGVAEDITAQCTWSGGDLQCPLGDIPPFAPGEPSWLVQVDGVTLSDAVAGEYVNTATVTSVTPDGDPADNESQAPITITDPVATLSITKTATGLADVDGDGDADVVPGGTFAYVIEVANVLDISREGAADAPDTIVSDTLPEGFVVETASTTQGACTITPPRTVSCDLGTVLGPGRMPEPPPVRITLSGRTLASLAGTPSVVNTASAASPIAATVSAEAANDVVPVADLSIVKVADAEEFAAGGVAGFSLVVTNAGPSDAVATEVGDLFPAELTFDPEASDPTCTPATQEGTVFVSCGIGTLAAGETRTVRVGASIDPAQPPAEVVNISAVSSPTTGEYDFANNRSDAPVRIVQSADLVVTKTADAASQAAGESVTYTIGVTNAGPSDASAVEVVDTIPAGTILSSVGASDGLACADDGATVTCAQATLPSGASATVAIVVDLPETLEPGPVTNIVEASSDTPDPDQTSNTASATVDVFVNADIAVTKSVLTPTPTAGRPISFAIDVVNAGPQAAPRVVVSDSLVDGLVFSSATVAGGTCGVTAPEGIQIVTCEIASLAVGDTARVVVTAVPEATGTEIVNGALVGSAALDAVSADNYDEILVTVAPGPGDGGETPPTDPGTPPPARGETPAGGGLPPTGVPWPLQALLWGIALIAAGVLLSVAHGLDRMRRRGELRR